MTVIIFNSYFIKENIYSVSDIIYLRKLILKDFCSDNYEMQLKQYDVK